MRMRGSRLLECNSIRRIVFIILCLLCGWTDEITAFPPNLAHTFPKFSRPQPSKFDLVLKTNGCRRLTHQQRSKTTRLYLDVFGASPAELILAIVVGAVLFGPDTLKKRGKEISGKEEELVGWEGDLQKKIDLMTEEAEKSRRQRALSRLRKAVENNDPIVMKKMDEYDRLSNPELYKEEPDSYDELDVDGDDDDDFDREDNDKVGIEEIDRKLKQSSTRVEGVKSKVP